MRPKPTSLPIKGAGHGLKGMNQSGPLLGRQIRDPDPQLFRIKRCMFRHGLATLGGQLNGDGPLVTGRSRADQQPLFL